MARMCRENPRGKEGAVVLDVNIIDTVGGMPARRRGDRGLDNDSV
jgi:hypothetical protein